MASEVIGRIACLLCGDETPLKEQRSGFAMYNCDWCGSQHFARSKHSDEKMRARMVSVAPPPKEKPVEPEAKPEPAPVEVKSTPKPAAKPAPVKAPEKKKHSLLGF